MDSGVNFNFANRRDYLNLNQQRNQAQLTQQFSLVSRFLQQNPSQLQQLQGSDSGQAFVQTLNLADVRNLGAADIQKVQRFLHSQGYQIGSRTRPDGIDGKYGPKTHSALQHYMSQLNASGPQGATVSEIDFAQALGRIQQGQLQTQDVKTVQGYLVQKGFNLATRKDPSGVDGQYGPKTHQALNRYLDQIGRPTITSDQLQLSAPPRQRAARPTVSLFPTDAGPQIRGGSVFSSKASSISSWFTPQFGSGGHNPRADCGPAVGMMILRSHGLGGDRDLGDIRRDHMRVRHNGATTSNEVARGIESGSGNALDTDIVAGNSLYRSDPAAFLNRIKQELAAGKQVILLTKNMATMRNGHYVVVQGVKDDNSIVVADPGSRSQGQNRTFSFSQFERAFHARRREGMPNNLIVVSR